jgi:hypothetical protein
MGVGMLNVVEAPPLPQKLSRTSVASLPAMGECLCCSSVVQTAVLQGTQAMKIMNRLWRALHVMWFHQEPQMPGWQEGDARTSSPSRQTARPSVTASDARTAPAMRTREQLGRAHALLEDPYHHHHHPRPRYATEPQRCAAAGSPT